jgi:hypothetical protein
VAFTSSYLFLFTEFDLMKEALAIVVGHPELFGADKTPIWVVFGIKVKTVSF